MNPVYKNILLINPWEGELFPPPSIGYLQGTIKHFFGDSISVTCRDLSAAYDILLHKDFDLVAVSFHSFSVKHARNIRAAVKKTARLVCGGHHPSAMPEQMINIGYDQVGIGEGENILIDIILGNTESVIYNSKSHFKDINEIPFPDYSGLSGDWLNTQSEYGYPIISSRGCPFSCNFCASSIFWNRKINMRSADSVISEIVHNIETVGMRNYMFEDDNFTLNKKRVTEICNRLINDVIPKYGKRNWQCASRAETLIDADLCRLLKEAGCTRVWLGVESFSQPSLDRCEKHTTVEKLVTGIETAESNGLKTMSQFIVGLPDDTISDIMETARIIKSTNMSTFGGNVAWILPATNIHKRAKAFGFDDNVYLESGTPFYTYEQSMETLNSWSQIINNAKQ